MHELSLMADLMRTIQRIAHEQGARRVSRVKVVLGALAHISSAHLREHFDHASRGTLCEGAQLEVSVSADVHDPAAQDIVLESVDVEVDEHA